MHPQIIQLSAHQDPQEVIELILAEYNHEHYEVMSISPSGSSITINQIRELRREIQLMGARNRTIAFYSFEKATLEAQNAMLKVLEELNARHLFLLFTTNIDALLPTIRSRCSLNRSYEVSENIHANSEITEMISSIRRGKAAEQMAQSNMQPGSLEEARALFRAIISELRESATNGDQWAEVSIKKALELLALSESNNLNAQLSVDLWVLDAKNRI